MLGYPVSPLPRATMQTGPGAGEVPQFAGVSWYAQPVQPGHRESPRLQTLPVHMLFWAHLPVSLPPEELSKCRAEIIRWR